MLYKMNQYFLKPFEHFRKDIEVELDLTNYARKHDLKSVKTNLAGLKEEVDKIGINKLKALPADLSKLSNVVDNGC